ncbi:NifB/NifX family molybdenum-iron cluster-binding protein [Sunxiuqinia elliptica]
MKVAITSTGQEVTSKLDHRFGRCSYFAIHDFDTDQTDFIKNPNKEVAEGAGPASVQFIVNHGVSKIISGEFGGKVKKILEDLEVQIIMFNGPERTIQDILSLMAVKP